MSESWEIRVKHRQSQDKLTWRKGFVYSVLLHLIVIIGWNGDVIPQTMLTASGSRSSSGSAVTGSLQVIILRTLPSLGIIQPPRPVEVEIGMQPVEWKDQFEQELGKGFKAVSPFALEPAGDTNTGAGDEGNAERGVDRLRPASPIRLTLPLAVSDLRGTQLKVRVFVDEKGRVVPDSTRLDPPSQNRLYEQLLIGEATEWTFRPGSFRGRPVSSWFFYTLKMLSLIHI